MTSEPIDPRRAKLTLLTWKRGLLAAVGHDLCLGLHELRIELAAGAVHASFALTSLRVLGAMRRGALVATEPSEHDRRAILETVHREILHTDRHPRAELTGSLHAAAGRAELRGELELCGVKRPLVVAVPLATAGSTLSLRVELTPSEWGIAPYSALGGALKLQDRVQGVLDLDVDPSLLAAATTASAHWVCRR